MDQHTGEEVPSAKFQLYRRTLQKKQSNTHLRRTPKTHILRQYRSRRYYTMMVILKRRRKIELFSLIRGTSSPLDAKAGIPKEARRVDHSERVFAFLRECKDAG